MATKERPALHPGISSLGRGRTVYCQGDVGNCWYEVARGFLRLCHYFGDGRRQVLLFAGPGDAFGFETGLRQYSAETLTEVELVRHSQYDECTQLLQQTSWSGPHPALRRALKAVEDTMRLFSYGNATERIAAFLLQFAAYSEPSDIIALPMSRQDLADHLSLTMHTVSRSISELARRGYFELEKPDRIRITDQEKLEGLVGFEKIAMHDRLVA